MIPNEAYTMLTGPFIPTIPLFTLAGFILSESRAGERLVRFFQACFGWLPGGLVIMTILISAFFTTFTGASGVTILALGGLLSYVLISSHYEKNFSLGLLTAGGSLGLLLPPSLPIILYGVVSQTNIKHMFIGGVLPDLLMITSVALLGIAYANRVKIKRTRFNLREVLTAFRYAFWEILLPPVILFCYLRGLTTLVETSALAVLYTLVVEMVIHRDIKPQDLPGVFQKCIPIIGGVLIILAIAKGLSYFIVDAEIPLSLSDWVSRNIHSKYLFLILLNISLVITGCLMDIFSAIIVVVPLILPLGAAFDIHPVHLGVIFLVNLELGYLTPPVGINLFLASYRFNEPLSKIYRNIIPYLIILFITVLIITYIPWFSTGLLSLLGL
jgi:tripartite ATP-independent transporter DctM subunit